MGCLDCRESARRGWRIGWRHFRNEVCAAFSAKAKSLALYVDWVLTASEKLNAAMQPIFQNMKPCQRGLADGDSPSFYLRVAVDLEHAGKFVIVEAEIDVQAALPNTPWRAISTASARPSSLTRLNMLAKPG